MLGIVIFISLVLIACNALYETDEINKKTNVVESKLNNTEVNRTINK